MRQQQSAMLACAIAIIGASFLAGGVVAQDLYTPPRSGLQIIEPEDLRAFLQYQCEDDPTKMCTGMPHSEALFGIPLWGNDGIRARLYDATPDPSTTGCEHDANVYTRKDEWQSPYILLVNRGKCHFTDKVRYAEKMGAAGVIIKDNRAQYSEPIAICSDYSMPQYLDATSNKWKDCTMLEHTGCFCGADHTTPATPLTTAPLCPAGMQPAFYEKGKCPYKATDGSMDNGCWRCGSQTCKDQSNVCIFKPASCYGEESLHCAAEHRLPFMADDGSGGNIQIPSFIVSDYYGQLLRNAVKSASGATIKMQWDIKSKKVVDYELWTSAEDRYGSEFKRDFQETALKLIEKTNFKPRYYIVDGWSSFWHCNRPQGRCGTQCLSKGKYCGPDPDDDLDKGVSGADVTRENLRQLCIWDVVSADKDNKKDQMKWWCYVNDFGESCFTPGGESMQSGDTFEKCSYDLMDTHGIDRAKVKDCVDKSFTEGETSNVKLDQEIEDRKNFGILVLPTPVVNGVVLRGETQFSGGSFEKNVANAICNAFTNPPEACAEIIHPSLQIGNARVQAAIKFAYKDASPLSTAIIDEDIVKARFRATLGLKIAVNPTSIILGDLQNSCGGKCVSGSIEIRDLRCPDENQNDQGTKKVKKSVSELLREAKLCELDAAEDDDEVEEELSGRTFFFHTTAKSNYRQIQVTFNEIEEDNSECPTSIAKDAVKKEAEKSRFPIAWIVIISVFFMLVVLGAAFIWYKRAQEQMRSQVQDILAQYVQMDDIAIDEAEDASMIQK